MIKATINFFLKAPQVHGHKYDYSKVVYVSSAKKVSIICPIHGEFQQQPTKHLNSRTGCKKCVHDSMKKSTKVYDRELHESSNGEIIRLSSFDGMHSKIKVRHTCGTEWEATANSLLREGLGCPSCAVYGFNLLKPGILYYVKVTKGDTVAYKVGVTNTTVHRRFGPDMKYITILKTWKYDVGADAYQVEQNVLKLNKHFKYEGPSLLRSGNTELFHKDVGGYDSE